jgi:VWFA-related protein
VRGAARIRALVVAALLFHAASVTRPVYPAGQPRTAPPPPVAGIEHVVRDLVLIEVHASAGRGRPVTDLTLADFVLRVDGHTAPEPIASLEVVGEAAVTQAGGRIGAGVEGPAPVPAGSGTGGIAGAAGAPRRTVLFFEDADSLPFNMTAARIAARRLLERSPAGAEEFALASYDDHRGLRVLHDFTTDRRGLQETLKASEKDLGRFSGLQSMDARKGTMTPTEFRLQAPIMAREDQHHLARVLSTLRVLVDGLAPWPGRKAVVYLGDGIPMNPADMYGITDPLSSLGPDMNALVTAATAANVTLDAIQASGIGAGPEERASSLRAAGLSNMTLDTGGRRFITNDLAGALGEIETAAEHYYVLGYAPEGPPDGRRHTIALESRRPGVTLRYRRAFTRFTVEETRARLIAAAFIAPELHHILEIEAVVLPGPTSTTGRLVDLVVYLPASGILFLPRPGGASVATLEIGVVALDDGRREAARAARRVDATLGPEVRSQGGIGGLDLACRVSLPPSRLELTVVVSDLGSGQIGAVRLAIDPADPAGAPDPGPALYAAGERSLWINLGPLDPQGARTQATTRVGPALRTRFALDEAARLGLWRPASLGGDASASRVVIRRGRLSLRSVALDPALLATRNAGGGDEAEAALSLHGLEAGEYTVGLEGTGPAGDALSGRFAFLIRPPPSDAKSEVP